MVFALFPLEPAGRFVTRLRFFLKMNQKGSFMGRQSRFSLLVAALVLAPAAVSSAEADLPRVAVVSIQVRPLTAVSSPGKTLFFTVNCEGVGGVGTQTPLSVSGAPEGTNLEVSALTEQDALLGIALPSTAAKGRYTLLVRVGGPAPLVEQEIAIEIGE